MTKEPLRFPGREQWARDRRTVFVDVVDKVTAAVSTNPANYALTCEITQAAAELGDYWRKLGKEVRTANQEARRVFPLYGSRVRRRVPVLALVRARDALSDDDKAILDHADTVKHHRQLVNDAIDQLTGADGRAYLHAWTIDGAEKWMPANACPTWKAIVARWKTACARTADEYRAQVAERPIDDAAWEAELRRRADIEQGRGVRIVSPRTEPARDREEERPA